LKGESLRLLSGEFGGSARIIAHADEQTTSQRPGNQRRFHPDVLSDGALNRYVVMHMKRSGGLKIVFLLMSIGLVAMQSTGSAAQANPASSIDFTRDIQPILADNCYMCHGPDSAKRKGHLRLDKLDPVEGPFAPRDGYAIITPGKLDDSVLISRILSDDPDVKMPQPQSHRSLTNDQLQQIQHWVEAGAKWGKHWSLIPPKRPDVPSGPDAQKDENPIDAFVRANLKREKLSFAPEADKQTLIRRITLDLTGLPPAPQEVEAFLKDSSPVAYEKVVDRLLASPRYGERMAWEWLDLARYADTNGYQGDPTRTMWPWRDWLVRALNDNMPFDQFVTWQLAGDLLPNATQDQRLASAFNRNHAFNGEGGRIPEETRVENVMDRTETFGTALLGMTIGCARCHDHKFDPISQREYYQLFAYFNQCSETGEFQYVNGGNVKPVLNLNVSPETNARLAELKKNEDEAAARLAEGIAIIDTRQAAWERSLQEENQWISSVRFGQTWLSLTTGTALPDNVMAALTVNSAARTEVQKKLVRDFHHARIAPEFQQASGEVAAAKKAVDDLQKTITTVMIMDDATPRQTHVLIKGSYDKPAETVSPAVPAALGVAVPAEAPRNRLGLARWLVEAKNPLTARVAVNRYWQQFFGVGLVKTAEDFGVQGERPSNPQLLDWLAVEFRESRWNVKAIQRLMLTSRTYRQSGRVSPQLYERDPENRLLARGSRFRLPACVIRDQALAAGGLLVEKLGGPPVKPYQPANVWEDATFGQIKYEQDHGESLHRRSLYTFWRRIVAPTEFFDSASRTVCTVRTPRTNTPLHALITLNDPTFVEAARALAERIILASDQPSDRIDLAYQLVLARPAQTAEREVLLASLKRLRDQYAGDRAAALHLLAVGESPRNQKIDAVEHACYTVLCLEILNLDEALTRQ
jgi:hypothetical protein